MTNTNSSPSQSDPQSHVQANSQANPPGSPQAPPLAEAAHGMPLPEAQTKLIHFSRQMAQRLDRRANRLHGHVTRNARRLKRYQDLRLGTGLVFLLGLLVLTVRTDLRLELPWIVIGVTVFSIFVIATRRLQRHVRRLRRYLAFTRRQLRRARGQEADRPSWSQAAKNAEDFGLPRDIGLFGSHSLWTLIDETLTEGGQKRLIEWMATTPSPSGDDIRGRQEKIRSLRSQAWFYTRLALEVEGAEFKASSAQVLDFIRRPFVENNFRYWLLGAVVTWILVLTILTLALTGVWPQGMSALPFAFVLFGFVNFSGVMKSAGAFMKGVGLTHHLNELAPIFAALEKRAPRVEILKELCPVTALSGPSLEARRLNRSLAFLSTQANPLVHLIVNALMPWTLVASYFLERRRQSIARTFPSCIEELAEFEALGSLVIFDRYQTRVYPQFAVREAKPTLRLHGAFHPLIPRESVIANDFSFSDAKSLGLLTGSNMAGKSTFLRTVGINQILANMGAPVFADEFQTWPCRLETCIEVSDSLRDGFSYFYSEVRRLRNLLASAEAGESMLFLIDEIFRGTNNRERHIGSRAVIRALARAPKSMGFISTHDLELTVLEELYPALVNLHFREDISSDGKMIFTYRLHHGPCPTTNALKIMEAEGIDLEGL